MNIGQYIHILILLYVVIFMEKPKTNLENALACLNILAVLTYIDEE